jgi:predicted enzyme related to lactoylglutathione lyase/quinol monooxygenase YgiN
LYLSEARHAYEATNSGISSRRRLSRLLRIQCGALSAPGASKSMSMASSGHVSLISRWFLRPGAEDAGWAALRELASAVFVNEPDTLTYLVHAPLTVDPRLQSLPPVGPLSVEFFEVYRDARAFLNHVNGPVFTRFAQTYGALFVASDGRPFTTVEFMTARAGFSRPGATASPGQAEAGGNRHPSVMFEVSARDQALLTRFYADVFGWSYATGTGGFAYVHFPVEGRPLLGGVGQADPGRTGFEPGHRFYLLVDNLAATIERAAAAGGARYVPPVSVDGYSFAMIKDPEGNVIGLIEPFAA